MRIPVEPQVQSDGAQARFDQDKAVRRLKEVEGRETQTDADAATGREHKDIALPAAGEHETGGLAESVKVPVRGLKSELVIVPFAQDRSHE